MPPRKTTGTKKTTTRKTAAKKPARKTTARKPQKRNYRNKKQDKRLPVTALLAGIPILLLSVFIMLRFSGGEAPATPPKPAPVTPPAKVERPIVKKVEIRSVLNTIKLFMFEHSLRSNSLTVNGSSVYIKTDTNDLSDELKAYLIKNKITVDGDTVLTAEDSHGIYNISFVTPEPVKKTTPKAEVKPVSKAKSYKAKLAIVIDDCGYSIPLAKKLAAIHHPVTLAVIPFTPHGKETALITKKAGKTLFLHFPMQPKSYPKFDPGKGALFLNMPESVIAAVTKANFEYFPVKVDGANNHTGSAYTESAEKMSQALKYMKSYTTYFMDSYTSGRSVAYETCQNAGMNCAVNNVFLDNEEPGLVTIADKRNHVRDQLMKAANKALKNGSAIAIGHLREGTVSGLERTLDEIENMGVQIVSVRKLMH